MTTPPADREDRSRAEQVISAVQHRPEWIGGAILIGLGLLFLFGQVIPALSQYIVLIIGLGFLTSFLVTRLYGMLIPGGIVTGVGVGIVLASANSGVIAGALFLFSLAAGFVLIFVVSVLLRMNEPGRWWPLIPAVFIALGGVTALSGQTVDWVWQYGWAIAMMVIGVFLLLRAYLGRQR
ncbi:MAG: hypothetical protein U0556_15420 [Dehalococcoidia bacterium]